MSKSTRNEKLGLAYAKGFAGEPHKYVFPGYIDMYNEGVKAAAEGKDITDLPKMKPKAPKAAAKAPKAAKKSPAKPKAATKAPKAAKKSPAKPKAATKAPKAATKPKAANVIQPAKPDPIKGSGKAEEAIAASPTIAALASRMSTLESQQASIVTTLEALVASLKPSSKASF